jgi:biofilm PGA synthesis lipoprotein PgaB
MIFNSKIKRLSKFFSYPFLFLLFFIFLSAPVAFAKETTEAKPYFTDQGQYNYARFLFDYGDYNLSAREFGRLIESFPGSPLTALSQFMIASSYHKAGRLGDAAEEYARFIENFPGDALGKEAKKKLLSVKVDKELFEPLLKAAEVEKAEPIRAVQVFYFDGGSTEEMEAELAALSRGGIDTIIVRAFHNPEDRFHPSVSYAKRERFTSGVYFNTTHAPVVEDFLAEVIESAKKYNLKVYAWMTTRYADYGIEDREDLRCRSYDLKTNKTTKCKGLDLFNEEVVKRLEGLYSDLADYEIDGILFQDDMVLRHTEGYGAHAAQAYEEEFLRPLTPELFYFTRSARQVVDYTGLFWEWASWKNRRLLDVASRLRSKVREKRPKAKFAINLMYEAVTNPGFGLAWLSQNIEESKKIGFDYYSIMAYHRQMAGELRMSAEETKELIEALVREAVSMVGSPEKVMIKFQTRDWNTRERINDSEVVEMLRSVRSVDDVSLTLVPYQSNFPYYELGGKADTALMER